MIDHEALQGKVLGIELVGAFKRRCMRELLDHGLLLYAAYGNTMTGAHAASGAPPVVR